MGTRKMKEIPPADRPYERCVRLGPERLSDEELLSIIIRTGGRKHNSLETARQILGLECQGGGILGLCRLSLNELMSVEGIGTVKGIQLLCVGELSRRISRKCAGERREHFSAPDAVADYYMEQMRHLEQEHLCVMLLDSRNALIRELQISKGTVNASLASPREVYIEALKHRAVSIILVHNHPSGDPTPSEADCSLTRRVKQAGELIGIPLLDHVVIGDHTYCSLKREGII